MKRAYFFIGLVVAMNSFAANTNIYHDGWIDLNKNGSKDVYEDPAQPIEKRVEDLLSQMTLEEKSANSIKSRGMSARRKFTGITERGAISCFFGASEIIESPTQRNTCNELPSSNRVSAFL